MSEINQMEWEGFKSSMDEKQSRIEELEKRNAELESALCETCKDPVCEDSQLGYWILKAQGYEKALREIADFDCVCSEYDFCPVCIAKKELRGGE
jgi:hypothetical protein